MRIKCKNKHGAPELKDPLKQAFDLEKIDVYLAGIFLFSLMTGYLPYIEDEIVEGLDLANLLDDHRETFWAVHHKLNPDTLELSKEFKELFECMTTKKPELRYSMA